MIRPPVLGQWTLWRFRSHILALLPPEFGRYWEPQISAGWIGLALATAGRLVGIECRLWGEARIADAYARRGSHPLRGLPRHCRRRRIHAARATPEALRGLCLTSPAAALLDRTAVEVVDPTYILGRTQATDLIVYTGPFQAECLRDVADVYPILHDKGTYAVVVPLTPHQAREHFGDYLHFPLPDGSVMVVNWDPDML